MKHALCILAVFAPLTTAAADVRLFVTGSNQPYGLTDPTAAFMPTTCTVYPNGDFIPGFDYYYHHLSAAPPIDAPDGTPENPILLAADEFAYVWFQFRDEPQGAIVQHLTVDIRNEATGVYATGAFAWYKQDCRSGAGSERCRWDGVATPPDYPEWTNNPQTLTAVLMSHGIHNEAAQPSDNWNLYTWQAGTVKGGLRTGVSLLGAIDLAPGLYSIHIAGPSYFAPVPDPAHSTVGYFRWIPEPASPLLLGLATLPLRRR
jgi:hypothetical protein